jgi:hypothetical protein
MTKPHLFLAAVLCLAAGCQPASEGPQQAQPQAITIIANTDGTLVLNKHTFTKGSDLGEALKQRAASRREAAPGAPPPKVIVKIPDLSGTSYEVFAMAILACGMAELAEIEAAGVPFRLPGASGCNPPPAPGPAFLPLDIRSAGDIERLREHAAELKGGGLLISPCMDTPLDLVLAVARVAHEAGAKVSFGVPYDSAAESGGVQIVLKHAPVDKNGNVMSLLPFPGNSLAHVDLLDVLAKEQAVPRSLFGIPIGDAHKIVFVMDRSGSMCCSIDYVKYELKRSIGTLDEKSEFHVIFYSSGPPVEMPTRRLVAATERNKQLAFEFIDEVIAQGETDPSKALEQAFATGPDTIYLLTDGQFDKSIVDLVKRLNPEKKVKAHTFCFLYKTGVEVLKQIAADNGGTYKFVSEADLAALGQQ